MVKTPKKKATPGKLGDKVFPLLTDEQKDRMLVGVMVELAPSDTLPKCTKNELLCWYALLEAMGEHAVRAWLEAGEEWVFLPEWLQKAAPDLRGTVIDAFLIVACSLTDLSDVGQAKRQQMLDDLTAVPA